MANLFKLAKGASPVFWYKLGLVVVLFVAYTTVVAAWATHRCELAHEQQKTEKAEQKTREVIKEVQVRIPEVQKIEVESAKQRQEIKRLKEALDVALSQRPENASCDLSDAEFNGVQQLAEKTHTDR